MCYNVGKLEGVRMNTKDRLFDKEILYNEKHIEGFVNLINEGSEKEKDELIAKLLIDVNMLKERVAELVDIISGKDNEELQSCTK